MGKAVGEGGHLSNLQGSPPREGGIPKHDCPLVAGSLNYRCHSKVKKPVQRKEIDELYKIIVNVKGKPKHRWCCGQHSSQRRLLLIPTTKVTTTTIIFRITH